MIKVHRCANGLRIAAEEIPHAVSVSIGIFVKAGSRNEAAHENGLTHFIEHMLFKGTKKRSAKDIARAFDRIGGDMNAYTSKEYTCYYATVLDRHGEQAADVLADMFFHSAMAEEEIDKERQVVLEEIHMTEDMPDDDVHEQLWRIMYPEHPIGAPILGTENTLSSFDGPAIRRFMERNYTPANTVVSLAGRITPGLLEMIEERFGTFARDSAEPSLGFPEFVPGFSLKKKETEQAHLCLGFPGVALKDPAVFSATVLNNMIGGTMSSRLFQEIREEQGLAYSIYSYHSAYADHGTFAVYAGTANNQLEKLQSVISATLKKIEGDGISGTELEDSKEQLKGSLLIGLESAASRMSRNGRQLLLLGELESPEEAIAKIESVSKHDVMDRFALWTGDPAVSIIRSR